VHEVGLSVIGADAGAIRGGKGKIGGVTVSKTTTNAIRKGGSTRKEIRRGTGVDTIKGRMAFQSKSHNE